MTEKERERDREKECERERTVEKKSNRERVEAAVAAATANTASKRKNFSVGEFIIFLLTLFLVVGFFFLHFSYLFVWLLE